MEFIEDMRERILKGWEGFSEEDKKELIERVYKALERDKSGFVRRLIDSLRASYLVAVLTFKYGDEATLRLIETFYRLATAVMTAVEILCPIIRRKLLICRQISSYYENCSQLNFGFGIQLPAG